MVTTCRYCGTAASGATALCPAVFNPSDSLTLYINTSSNYDTILWSHTGTGFTLKEGVTATGVTSNVLTGMHCMLHVVVVCAERLSALSLLDRLLDCFARMSTYCIEQQMAEVG